MHPVLAVGLQRSPRFAVDFAPESRSGQRLESVLCLRRGALLRAIDTVNLLGPGDAVNHARCTVAAGLLDVSGRELLLLLGSIVHRAFGFDREPTLGEPGGEVLRTWRGVRVALLPHPSGRNRDWNDIDFTSATATAIRALAGPLMPVGVIDDGVGEAEAIRGAAVRSGLWRTIYIENLIKTGNRRMAALAAGVAPNTALAHEKRDNEFAIAVVEALEQSLDRAELEVTRRGVHGTKRQVFHGGVVVGEATDYSDTLLLRRLEAYRPERWANRSRVAHTGPGDAQPAGITMREIREMALESERYAAGLSPESVDATAAAIDADADAVPAGDIGDDGPEPEE